jgi:type I restriction enzyme M protein
MIALPGQLFYTTQIPVCLWFVCKNKGQRPHPENPELHYRDRRGETLFIDARQIGTMIDRTQKELTKEDIAQIAGTYHNWRNQVPLPPSIPLKGEEGSDGTVIANREDQSGKQSSDGTDCRAALAMTFPYEDVAGYCKSASLSEIQANDFVLTPGRYVGVADEEDDGIHFEDKMTDLTATLKAQMAQAEQLDIDIRENLKVLGYDS